MKKVYLLLFAVGIAVCDVRGQITLKTSAVFSASPGTTMSSTTGIRAAGSLDLSNVSLMLLGKDPWQLSNTGTGEVILGDLTVDGASDYTVTGKWTISNSLTLTRGKLITDRASASPTRFLYSGPSDVIGGNADSFVDGPFFTKGLGVRTFPVGTSDGYFPARFENVVDDAELGFEVITGDANLSISGLAGVTEYFKDHYWQMHVANGSFTESPLSISTKLANDFFLTGSTGREGVGTILQAGADLTAVDLGGVGVGEFVTSTTNASAGGEKFAIAKVEGALITISEVLTPNGDGKNNVLKISNIELFPDNKVTLLDRYGVEVHKWTGFKNYTTTDAIQDFDFTSLAIGNYICVVEYTDPRAGSRKATQMITVLK